MHFHFLVKGVLYTSLDKTPPPPWENGIFLTFSFSSHRILLFYIFLGVICTAGSNMCRESYVQSWPLFITLVSSTSLWCIALFLWCWNIDDSLVSWATFHPHLSAFHHWPLAQDNLNWLTIRNIDWGENRMVQRERWEQGASGYLELVEDEA